MHHDTDGGLENVWLENGYTTRQTPYGPAVTIHDVDGLTRAICMALTDKASIVSGKEFRYIRQGGMALSQAALGKMPGVDEQSVARLEKTGRVPKWADKLIRLVYAAHANADAPIRRAIERARTVERLTSQRILVKESRHGWTPAIVNHEDDTAVVNGNRILPTRGNSNLPTRLGIGVVGRAQQPGLELFLEAIGVAPDIERDGVVKQAVQDRRGNHSVAEHLAPSAEALIAGQDHRPALIAPADELEEQIGTLPVDRQVADLVNDQRPGRGVELELVVELALGHGLGERADQVRGRGEQHPVAGLDALETWLDEASRVDTGNAWSTPKLPKAARRR